MDPMASMFKRWTSKKGKAITLRTRTEGAAGTYGNPAISFANSTVYARIMIVRADDVLTPAGYSLNDFRIIHIAIDVAIGLFDHFLIDSVEYELDGPPIVNVTFQRCLLRRLINQ